MKKFKLVWSARSECGPNRKKNEDSLYPSKSGSSAPPCAPPGDALDHASHGHATLALPRRGPTLRLTRLSEKTR